MLIVSKRFLSWNRLSPVINKPKQMDNMITIEITNLDELVKEHRGPVTALLGKIVADIEGEVEKIIMEEIRNEFERRGVRANFCSIEGIRLRRIITA